MIDEPTIVTTEAAQAAVIHLVVPREDIGKVMDPAIREVLAALAAQGIAPSGPMFSNHVFIEPKVFDFEVGFPVATAVAPTGRVRAGALPSLRAARTIYRGPYEGLGAGWGAFMAALAERGLATDHRAWERYVVGPGTEPDPAKWQTELNRPLAG